jgi:AcrR family transcriptional regulator
MTRTAEPDAKADTAARSGRAAPLPPDERRAAIVAAVLPLYVEQGEALTTRQMAVAAGVAEGTLFKAFADKDELVEAVIEAALDPAEFEQSVRAIDPALPFEEQLLAAVDLLQRRTLRIWAVMSGTIHKPRHRPRTSAALTELFERHTDRIVLEPAEAARLLWATTFALTQPLLVDTPTDAERIVHQFLHGAVR